MGELAVLELPEVALGSMSFDITKAAEDTETGRWVVEGYASTSDLDIQNEIITQEALEGAAQDLLKYSTVLYNHDMSRPIGRVILSELRENKLWVKIIISKEEPKIWAMILDETLSKFSISGQALKVVEHYDKKLKRTIMLVQKIKIVEVSIVAVPANVEAKTLRAYVEKSVNLALTQADISKAFKYAVCPECGYTTEKEPGVAARTMTCPKCKTALVGSNSRGKVDPPDKACKPPKKKPRKKSEEDALKDDNLVSESEEWDMIEKFKAHLAEAGLEFDGSTQEELEKAWAEFAVTIDKADEPYPFPKAAQKAAKEEEKPDKDNPKPKDPKEDEKPKEKPKKTVSELAAEAVKHIDTLAKASGDDGKEAAKELRALVQALADAANAKDKGAEETKEEPKGDPEADVTPEPEKKAALTPNEGAADMAKDIADSLEKTVVPALRNLDGALRKTVTPTEDKKDETGETPKEEGAGEGAEKGHEVDLDELRETMKTLVDAKVKAFLEASVKEDPKAKEKE